MFNYSYLVYADFYLALLRGGHHPMLNLFPVPQLGLYVTQGYCVCHVFTRVVKLSSWLFFKSPRMVNAPQRQ